MFNSEKTFQHLFVIIGLSILTCAVFYTALDSRFLLDDFINLRDLDRIARHGYMEFIFAGISGPGGRPVSLLSFALQHEAWPGNPFAFKLLNLVIHIINGSLIYVISLLICAKLRLSSLQKKLLCFFVTAIWLLHPIQSYTLLYVVQRMTLLSTTFMLLGIGFYLYFRELFSRGREKIALTGMIFSVAIFTAFAILSKENGILLPLYILVIEYTVFSKTINAGNWRPVSLGILLLPLIAFIFYIVFKFDTIMSAYAWREFTPGERLLTETLVLLDYLKNILIPAPHAFSLYHDDYPVSRTVFESMRIAFSVVLIFTFLVIALVLRKRWSIVSFAIFWFFAGHTLESSFIGLELYFEHRNYLPSYGILFLICWLAIKGSQNLISAKTGIAAITCYLVLILAVTVTEVNLWANPYLQALEWKKNHPTSKRALNNLWNIYLVTGQKEKADELRDEMRRLDPGDIYPEIKNIYANYCLDDNPLSATDWNKLYRFSEIAKFR
jgi:hypothetical protein